MLTCLAWYLGQGHANSSSSALASWKSAVSKPSVNQPYTSASSWCTSARWAWYCHRRARLMAARWAWQAAQGERRQVGTRAPGRRKFRPTDEQTEEGDGRTLLHHQAEPLQRRGIDPVQVLHCSMSLLHHHPLRMAAAIQLATALQLSQTLQEAQLGPVIGSRPLTVSSMQHRMKAYRLKIPICDEG